MKAILFLCVFLVSASAPLYSGDMSGLIDSAKQLMIDRQDSQAIDSLKREINNLENGLIKNKAIEVVGLSLISNDKQAYEQFKGGNLSYDFSGLETQAANPKALQKALSHLILNTISETEISEGRSPVTLAVEVNGQFDAPVQTPAVVDSVLDDAITEVNEKPDSPEMEDSVAVTSPQIEQEEIPLGKTEIATESIYYKVYHAAKKAQAGDSESVKEMLKLSLVKSGDEEVNGLLVKSIVLAMVNGNSKSLKPYMTKVDSIFPDESYLSFLEEDPFQKNCGRCDAKGVKEAACRKCTGGKCRNCKGKKEISYKGLGGEIVRKECAACKASGNCMTCKGESIIKSPCRTCAEKGTVFAKNVVPQEYANSLQDILDLMPKLADDNGLYIGVGIDRLALAKKEQQERQREEKKRLMAELVRKKKEEQRLAKLEAERKAKEKEEKMTSDGDSFVTTVTVEDFEEGGTNSTLKHALLELTDYLNAQEKRTKSNIYDKADAKFVNSFPTLLLEVSEEVAGLEEDLRYQYLDGFFQFWKLRCGQNRLGRTVGFVATHKGKRLAEMQKNELVLLP